MKKLYRFYCITLTLLFLVSLCCITAFAADDMWTVANRIIVDVYSKIAGVSTVLAGLMSAVAVIGAKLSNNQHKVDQAWDWLRRIWIAWAVKQSNKQREKEFNNNRDTEMLRVRSNRPTGGQQTNN